MNKKVLISGFMATSFLMASCVLVPNGERQVAGLFGSHTVSTLFAQRGAPRDFSDSEVASIATVGNMKLKEARLIKDNDAAFESKLRMIENAQREIRMAYFIYSDDDSSSAISNALIERAKSKGVQVKLLVDFITNYSKLDFFRMLELQGGKNSKNENNISVYFYNFPARTILEDAKYMTLPCPDHAIKTGPKDCATAKKPMMEKLSQQETTPFSKLFLAGIYGKNTTALKVALGYGAQINLDDYKNKKDMSKEEKAHTLDFFKLLKRASGGDLAAKIKLSVAMATYGETLNPLMNELTGRFPVINPTDPGAQKRSEAWDHLTDYTHHKLLIVDGNEFQLGGRNVEDSYHMKSRIKVQGRDDENKYIFMDTDFWGQALNAGDFRGIEASFDKLIHFQKMVATTTEVSRVVPNDLVQNLTRTNAKLPSPGETAVGFCLQQAKAHKINDVGSCIESSTPQMKGFVSLSTRLENSYKNMLIANERYQSQYRRVLRDSLKSEAWFDGIDSLSQKDLESAKVSYVENITYDKTTASERNTESRMGFETKFNKNIHALWYRGLENACQSSRNQNRDVRIIFHSAYLFMPSGLVVRLAKMLNGDYGDCSRVKISFLTNSIDTTDLNIINIAARYQMRELMLRYRAAQEYASQFQSQNGRKYPGLPPQIEYFEYRKSHEGTGVSLHTKLTLIDQDIIVGSANADVRSYYMDTNNAVFIRNAFDLNQDYISYFDALTAKSDQISRGFLFGPQSIEFESISNANMAMQNQLILAGFLAKNDIGGKVRIIGGESPSALKLKKSRQAEILSHIADVGARITNDTQRLLNFRAELNQAAAGTSAGGTIESSLNQLANKFDDFFKLL